jgi:hypothetical protein
MSRRTQPSQAARGLTRDIFDKDVIKESLTVAAGVANAAKISAMEIEWIFAVLTPTPSVIQVQELAVWARCWI